MHMCVCMCAYTDSIYCQLTNTRTAHCMCIYSALLLSLSRTFSLSGCLLLYVSLSLSRFLAGWQCSRHARPLPNSCGYISTNDDWNDKRVASASASAPSLSQSWSSSYSPQDERREMWDESGLLCQIPDFGFKFVSRGGFKGRLGKWPAARLPVGHVSPGTWYSIFLFVCLGPFWHWFTLMMAR